MNVYAQTPCSFNLFSSSVGNDNQSICVMDPIRKIEYSSVILPTITGLPTGLSTIRNGNIFAISGTPQQIGVSTFTITVADASCSTSSATGTITVVDNCCTVERLSGNKIQVNGRSNACVNNLINPISYAVELSSTITNLPPGLSFNTSTYPPTIEGTPTQTGNYALILTSVGNNCNTRQISPVISVSSCSPCQANLKTTSGPTVQTVCKGTPMTMISYDPTLPYTVIGLPPGVTSNYIAGMVCITAPCPGPHLDISGSPTVEGIYTYTLVPESGSCVPTLSKTGTITVAPNSTTNPNACPGFISVKGSVYQDNNSNCSMDSGDQSIDNIHIKLYDSNNNLLAHRYTSSGAYDFTIPDPVGGTYTVKLDTEGKPFTAQCVSPGLSTSVTLTTANPGITDVNFNINCVQDIGVQSVVPRGRVFPGQLHMLSVVAGDMNDFYHFSCSPADAGTAKVTVTGPVTFIGIAQGSRTPAITGNEFTYTITDWGTVNVKSDFGLFFKTDTTAQAGDTVCVIVVLTTFGSDFDSNNNTYSFCYRVNNSYDPNLKEVYPVDVGPGFEYWLTYTIHFQNTGNAPAINIRLKDTLDANLNVETFQVLNYSHPNIVSVYNDVLNVYYPNIELADSASNPEGSKGFVQYRIKPKANLPLGTKINNTANIYFDYNPPIATNTTVNEFKAGIISVIENEANTVFAVYPNPGTGKYFIKLLEGTTISSGIIEVYNLLGELVLNSKVQNNITAIDLSQEPNGVYFINIITESGVYAQKLIINK